MRPRSLSRPSARGPDARGRRAPAVTTTAASVATTVNAFRRAACPALTYAACAAPEAARRADRPRRSRAGSGTEGAGRRRGLPAGERPRPRRARRPRPPALHRPERRRDPGSGAAGRQPAVPNPGDQTNAIYHAAGVLPRDAVHYESAAIVDPQLDPSAPGAYAAVIFRGHLESDPHVTVVTRYELRPCEPGVRVRSDLYNGTLRPEDALPGRRVLLGRQRPGALRSWAGARVPRAEPRSRAPRSGLAAMAVSRGPVTGGARHRVRGDRLRLFAVGWVQQLFAHRGRRAARRDPAGGRISLRTLHPRRAGPRPGPGGGRGAARPDGGARGSARRDRQRPPGRERRAESTPARGGPPRCCSTSPPPARTSTTHAASRPGTRSSPPATARSRWRCRPTAATASSPTLSACRPRPPPPSSWRPPTCRSAT